MLIQCDTIQLLKLSFLIDCLDYYSEWYSTGIFMSSTMLKIHEIWKKYIANINKIYL